MKFNEGEEVLAKTPASGEFQKGKVVNVRGTNYRVQLTGGSEITVKEADIKVIFNFPFCFVLFVFESASASALIRCVGNTVYHFRAHLPSLVNIVEFSKPIAVP